MTVPSDMTPDGSDADDGTNRRASDFVNGLPEVANPSGREMLLARVGLVVMVIGLIIAIVAVILSQSSDNPLDQSTQLTIGVAGIATTIFGGIIFLRYSLGRLLRYWLLRMLHEMHDRTN